MDILWLSNLPNMVLGTALYYPVQVQITGMEPQAIDSVRATILNSSGQEIGQFGLYDDANAFIYHDAPDYCDSASGDLVANNGIFSRRLNSLFSDLPATFFIRVATWTGSYSLQTENDTLLVSESQPPQWAGLVLPDTLLSGFAPLQITVQVFDPDALAGDSVTTVDMRLFTEAGDLLEPPILLERLDQTHFGQTISADFAAGYPSADYIFAFRAWDTFNVPSDSLGQRVYMQNLPPHLSDSVLPDTIPLPMPGDTTAFPITINCWDDQGIGDIFRVTLHSQKPDFTFGSIVEMFDDGDLAVSGDSLQGDSIYTRIVEIWPSNLTGRYYFYFRGIDHADTTELLDSLWVAPL